MSHLWSVYVLQSPKDGSIRYIGISTNPKKRLASHLRDVSKTHKTNWLASLKAEGLLPHLQIILSGLSEKKAKELEVSIGMRLSELPGAKLTNDLGALGSKPPARYGKNNISAKKRPFKIWNIHGEEWFFDYQFEVKKLLGQKVSKGLYRVLNGTRRSILGLYACYIDEIDFWVEPKGNTGINNPSAQKRPFKIWIAATGEEWFFDYQFEAMRSLGLKQRTVSQMLRNNQYTKNKYYACYIDLLDRWTCPVDRRIGSKSNLSKKRPYRIWNKKFERIYDYQFEAVKELNLCNSGLSMLLCGKIKTHKGYSGRHISKQNIQIDNKHKKYNQEVGTSAN